MLELMPNPLVWGITGNLGGGKSLSAVALGVNAMSKGYFVVSNIHFKMDVVSRWYGDWTRNLYQEISVDTFKDPFQLPCGDPRGTPNGRRVLVILDEVAEWFNQYQRGDKGLVESWSSWLRHTSKRGQDIVLIVQRAEYLHKQLRSIVSRWVEVVDLAVYKLPLIKVRVPFFARGFCLIRQYDREGFSCAPLSLVGKKAYGCFYDTAQCLSVHGSTYQAYDMPVVYEKPWGLIIKLLVAALLLRFCLSSVNNGRLGGMSRDEVLQGAPHGAPCTRITH